MKIICTLDEQEGIQKACNLLSGQAPEHGYCPLGYAYCKDTPLGEIEEDQCKICIKKNITYEITDEITEPVAEELFEEYHDYMHSIKRPYDISSLLMIDVWLAQERGLNESQISQVLKTLNLQCDRAWELADEVGYDIEDVMWRRTEDADQ